MSDPIDLKAYRKTVGWTQPKLARRARCSVLTVKQIENGKRVARIKTARKLSRATGGVVSVATILSGPAARPAADKPVADRLQLSLLDIAGKRRARPRSKAA